VALLDVTRTDDRHTVQRLSAEPIIWLGTVRPDGRPQWRSTFSQPLLIHVERIIAWTRTAAGVAYRVVP